MKRGDILEAIDEEGFLVEFLALSDAFDDSFLGRVITFPEHPEHWINAQEPGRVGCFENSDFRKSARHCRDKMLEELGIFDEAESKQGLV